tara:strand:+ start:417 stop:1754 length:1338 start_codon:yes stop_codon:yes gene_type:complete
MAKNYWIKQGSFSFLANIAAMGFAFITFLFLVRVLSKDDFGVWVLYLTVTSFAEMARQGFVQNGLISFCTQNKDDYDEIITAGLVLNVVAGLLGALVIAIIANWLGSIWGVEKLPNLLWLYPLYVITYGTQMVLTFIQNANQQFKVILIANIIYGVSNFSMVIAYWFYFESIVLSHLIFIQCISALLAMVYSLIKARSMFTFGKVTKKWVGKLFHYGKYVFGTNFSSMLLNKMDIIMIGFFITPIAVATYNVASRMNNYIEVPMNSIASIVFPKISERYKKEGVDAVRYLYERSTGLMLAIIIPAVLGVVVLAKPIILLLAGKEYLEAVPVLMILTCMAIVKPWGRLFGITLDATGNPKINFRMLLLSLAINVITNLILIPTFGMIGAAWATFVSVVVTIGIGQVVVYRMFQVKFYHAFIYMFRFYKEWFHKALVILKLKEVELN